jgi:CHAD domain-containing protein
MLHGVESGDVRAVHRARVASRRLRELVPVLQLDPESSRKLGKRLREVTRQLGTARELDALGQLVGELQASKDYPAGALQRVAEDIRARRAGVRAGTDGAVQMDKLRRLSRKLDDAAAALEREGEGRPGARGWRWALEARVARRASRLASAIDSAGAVYLPERLHAVRIAVKKLRYGVELSAEASGAKADSDLRALKRWQDLLGRLHDLQMLLDRVRHLQAALPPSETASRHEQDALLTSLERTCRHLHARYVRVRPAMMALADRFAARTVPARRRAG